VDRRSFLLSGIAATAYTALPSLPTQPLTFTQWMSATPKEREQGLQKCLDRIREMDSSIHAWVQVSPQKPTGDGKLAGIPFGVKDIIETRGMATEYGSPIYKGRISTEDAAIARDMRQRGGVMMGKTHCASFAYKTPPPTRNPRNLEHTPGGSSSGSAAAVAAGMVPIALGTQTRGSVLRPASFCGVTGFKPTYGWFSMEGVLPLAKTQDTLGLMTHSAADMLLLWDALGHGTGEEENFALGVPDPLQEVEPEMAKAFANALSVLRKAGLSIQPVKMGDMLDKLADFNEMIMFYEGARFHKQRFEQYGSRLEDLADLVRDGLEIPAQRYDEGMKYIAECKVRVAEMMKVTPVMVLPAAPGPAPLGLGSTGNAKMNAPWTALGTPAISIPMPVQGELPLGLQLAAGSGQDARVLKTAVRVQKILDKSRK
jgi:Asp-tRNA(Asn)/Glu-tRNA(Gln) amidotransferase A subunit family amidase